MHFFKPPKSRSKRDSTLSNSTYSSAPSTSSPNASSSPQSVAQPRPESQRQTQQTHHPNTSSSNLSTTSTLYDQPPKPTPAPLPAQQTPQPPPNSYEAFLAQSYAAELQRAEREERMARAWLKAEERRKESRNWPHDPWRGGFGPPSSGAYSYAVGVGGLGGMNPRRE